MSEEEQAFKREYIELCEKYGLHLRGDYCGFAVNINDLNLSDEDHKNSWEQEKEDIG